jgi:uncharacterized protein YegP (UPF0339 family)
MAAKFEIYQDKSEKWRFRLRASNGQVIASGQGYASKRAAQAGIASVQKNAPSAAVVETQE